MPTDDRAAVYEILTTIFHDVFDDESIILRDAMTAKDVAEWDSLNHINLVIAVEKKFKIKCTAAEVGRLANVGQFVDLILRKTGRATG